MGDPTSRELLRRVKQGDRGALEELFSRHLPRLRRWTRGRLGRWARTIQDTSDLIQEAALRTFQHLGTFEPRHDKALQAYLRTTVQSQISDEYRRIAVRGVTAELDENHADTAPSPLDATVAADIEARYRRALAQLNDSERELIVGRVELGYSHEQLAAMTGRRSPDAARVALRRALVRLAGAMARG